MSVARQNNLVHIFSFMKLVYMLPLVIFQNECFSYFSTKAYVVGTQKNRLNETVLLITQNTCLN